MGSQKRNRKRGGLVESFSIDTKYWRKGERISSKRVHTTSGFRYQICESTEMHELIRCLSNFMSNNCKILNFIKSHDFSSELDIGVIVDISNAALVSLQLPLDIQVKRSEFSISLIFTVMLSDS